MNIKNIPIHLVKILTGKEKINISLVQQSKEKAIPLDGVCFYDNIENMEVLNNHFKSLVAIDGCGFSGSSAVTDFLAEFNNMTSIGGVDLRENPDRGIDNCFEFDFFRDANSIFELEKICYSNVGRIRDKAIHNFIKVCNDYYNSGISCFDDFFYNEAKKFIKNITDYTIQCSPEWISYVPKRLTVKEYRNYAKQFLLSVLNNISKNDILVVDNLMAISDPNVELLKDYFGDFKIIYVYSDPRDVYARARLEPGNDWVPKAPDIFVKFFLRVFPNYLQKSKENNSPILCISFDEFCNHYENVSKEIMGFLDLNEEDHIYKFKFFNPNISINNTRVYKKLENQEPIKYIYEQLKEYCYD